MTALADFLNSIASARSLIAMYKELRTSRGLGQRGTLTAANEDLLWLPRSAVVASLSSLDAYVHNVVLQQVPVALKANPIPQALCDAMALIVPIKGGNSFRDAMPIISSPDALAALTSRLQVETLSFLSYQMPDKIAAAYEMVGYSQVFDSVSATWPGPNSSANDLKRVLANFVRRRNQIAHEGDREAGGNVRHMQPQYARKCADFVENLVRKLNFVVYNA